MDFNFIERTLAVVESRIGSRPVHALLWLFVLAGAMFLLNLFLGSLAGVWSWLRAFGDDVLTPLIARIVPMIPTEQTGTALQVLAAAVLGVAIALLARATTERIASLRTWVSTEAVVERTRRGLESEMKTIRDEVERVIEHSRPIEVRIANAIQGETVDCDEPFLDCAKIVLSNDGAAIDVSVALRVDGSAPRIWLVRDGSRERKFTIYKDDHVNLPLFVRTRKDVSWNVHQAHGVRANLTPGPCYVLDEAFQLSGNPSTILRPGRHFLAFDVLREGEEPYAVSFNMFVPQEPQKSLWFQAV